MQPFQDFIEGNHCWGCGKDNPHGLQIKSFWDGTSAICRWVPQAWHCASPTHVVNGGILTALIDCHAIISTMAYATRKAGRTLGDAAPIWYVTGKLSIAFQRPTLLGPELLIRASFEEQSERKTLVHCSIHAPDSSEPTVTGEVLAIRVPASWMHAPGA